MLDRLSVKVSRTKYVLFKIAQSKLTTKKQALVLRQNKIELIECLNFLVFIYFFFIFYFYFNLYIYPPDSQESDGGAIHRVSNYPDLLPEMPRYCCPLVS